MKPPRSATISSVRTLAIAAALVATAHAFAGTDAHALAAASDRSRSSITAARNAFVIPAAARSMEGGPFSIAPETLFHTLASDFSVQRDGTVYVQTGDIPAMWLRDSAAQTLPYLRFAKSQPALRFLIRGVIEREARDIGVDPYANAFTASYRVWERKWEPDSLSYPVILAWAYWHDEGDAAIFTPALHRALARVVATFECEQRHAKCSRYRYSRGAENAVRGPVRANGMIWSAFRASDDPTVYGYNVPDQLQAITAMRDLAELASQGYGDGALSRRASLLSLQIESGVKSAGVVEDFRCGGRIYAYEVDGLGGAAIFDDANVPSLVGLPLGGSVSVDDPTYRRTRGCMLSPRNRYFARGKYAEGIGSPHTPHRFVWPLALISRALTADDRAQVVAQLRQLASISGPGGLVRESVDPNDPARFTRGEFGWGNAMYAELLFRTAAGSMPIAVAPSPPVSFNRSLPESIAVVDPMTAIANQGTLLSALQRAIPAQVAIR